MDRARKARWAWVGLTVVVLGFATYFALKRGVELFAEASAKAFVDQMRWLDAADPVSDARNAVAQKRYALMSVSGLMTSAPAFAGNWKDYDKKYGFIMIKGTSDVVMGEEHMRLIHKAYAYADQYNRYVLQHADYGQDEHWRVR